MAVKKSEEIEVEVLDQGSEEDVDPDELFETLEDE